MNNDIPEWLSETVKRIKAENVTVIADTPEKAKEYNVRLGDTVNIHVEQAFIANAQQRMDDFRARQIMAANPELFR